MALALSYREMCSCGLWTARQRQRHGLSSLADRWSGGGQTRPTLSSLRGPGDSGGADWTEL